ncbi:MAG: ABC transporter permease subunit [Burkholderiales bacterium]|nr:ABC transporter permease subunit [Burkholderiales bacterium]
MIRRALEVFLFLAALTALWQLLYLVSGDVALSSPRDTAIAAMELLIAESFWRHVRETFSAFGYALFIAAGGGLALGLGLGLHRLSGAVAEPILVSLYSLPKITLYPLILLVFGLGMSAKVAFGALHGIVPVTLFCMNAVRTVNPAYLKTGRIMRVSRGAMVFTIVLPAALPEVFSGLRVCFSLTLLGVLIGEMFASQRGLGFLIMNAVGLHDVRTVMAITLLLAAFAVCANSVLLMADLRLHRRV